jgi:hypothetical protein
MGLSLRGALRRSNLTCKVNDTACEIASPLARNDSVEAFVVSSVGIERNG